MIYTLGIDIGSTTSKCVLLEDGTAIAAKSLVVAGTGTDGPRQAFEAVLEQGGISREQVAYVMATGYGRATFSSCTVFAESEVISQLSKGVHIPDLVAGICNSVASRVAALAKRADVRSDVYMTGGVAKNQGVREALARELGVPVLTTEDAQYMGAMGAAVAAFEKCQKG